MRSVQGGISLSTIAFKGGYIIPYIKCMVIYLYEDRDMEKLSIFHLLDINIKVNRVYSFHGM